jgi:uncharacterized protein YjbI with pentapeptide repeats
MAVFVAVAAGGGMTVLCFALIRRFAGSSDASLDVLKAAFTAVAGVGGAVALVVAYRRQNDLEQGRFVERFGAAAAQLGDPDPAVRIAGVYAMAGAADESTTFSRRQQCIDVLCGYLRLPYDPDHGGSHHTELVIATKRLPSDSATQRLERQDSQYRKIRQNDREMRRTIVRVIAAHLQDHADFPWSHHSFDFSTAVFENFDVKNARFRGETTSFNEATFLGETTLFYGVTFGSEITSFCSATFSGDHTEFDEATFSSDHTEFDEATFSSEGTSFCSVTFSSRRTSFADVVFDGDATSFGGATFSGDHTEFDEATFSGKITWFDDTTFSGKTSSFHGATFSGEVVAFVRAVFSCEATSFGGAAFGAGNVRFDRAVFSGSAVSFEGPRRWENVTFDWDDRLEAMPPSIRPKNWPPVARERPRIGGGRFIRVKR